MVRKFPLFRSERKIGLQVSGPSLQFPNRFSGKLLFHLTFNRKFWIFLLNGKHPRYHLGSFLILMHPYNKFINVQIDSLQSRTLVKVLGCFKWSLFSPPSLHPDTMMIFCMSLKCFTFFCQGRRGGRGLLMGVKQKISFPHKIENIYVFSESFMATRVDMW